MQIDLGSSFGQQHYRRTVLGKASFRGRSGISETLALHNKTVCLRLRGERQERFFLPHLLATPEAEMNQIEKKTNFREEKKSSCESTLRGSFQLFHSG